MPYVTVLNIVLRCKHAPLLSLAHIRQIDSIYGLTLFTPPKAPIGSHIGCFISLGQPGSRVWGWNKWKDIYYRPLERVFYIVFFAALPRLYQKEWNYRECTIFHSKNSSVDCLSTPTLSISKFIWRLVIYTSVISLRNTYFIFYFSFRAISRCKQINSEISFKQWII